jgi:phospholipase/lecithinase/hemolysin
VIPCLCSSPATAVCFLVSITVCFFYDESPAKKGQKYVCEFPLRRSAMYMSPLPSILLLALQAAAALAFAQPIKNLVTFGDSYTDVVNIALGAGGEPWPVYAAGYGNLSLFPFARSGATCSNGLTPRTFPSILEDELPTYLNSTANGTALDPSETLYTLWIGTNDVGVGALLTGQSVPSVSIVNTSSCAVSWVQKLYDSRARNFLLQNVGRGFSNCSSHASLL